ncbi:phospholipase D-like domain-containing protein [Pseudomonas fluorescens]|uniref:phospholipase D-like domain-containing protein n=1 Tax=Pseudomonas fluorescens TaxID=294 RepID=UPI0012401B3E|nr:phospholipase D-like domain-containing protein [Pseudomonas fluorescens]VVO62022.1 Cardiolipin synthase A [Pseudomonas fluorescens]
MTTDYSKEVIQLTPTEHKSTSLTMDWFARKALYPPRAGIKVTPLINGDKAFGAVYDAIEAATKSVEIISWGFDPAMRFKPGSDRIGELLDVRGRHGVKTRVLIWKNPVANFVENTIIGDGLTGSGGTAMGSGITKGSAGSSRTLEDRQKLEYRRTIHQHELTKLRAGEIPAYGTSGFRYDQRETELLAILLDIETELSGQGGYNKLKGSGAPKYSPQDQEYTREWFSRVHDGRMQNVEFRTRDFSTEIPLNAAIRGPQMSDEKGRVATLFRLMKGEAPDTNFAHMLLLTLFGSHHQKMVLVDYEDTANAVGFVMGHNMHRNYWDTSVHLYDDKAARRSPGFGPWQDLSMKVQGPALHDLNHNFSTAWDRETFWVKKWFADGLRDQRQAIKPDNFKAAGSTMAQICRTQPQEGAETSILELYHKALGNVRNYAYFENQYFRYPPFAKQLRELAAAYIAKGKDKDLYLFVVTNNPNDKGFSSTTYATLQELGQEQLMPQAQRTLVEEMLQKRSRLAYLNENLSRNPGVQRNQLKKIGWLKNDITDLEKKGVTPELEQRLGGLKPTDIPELGKPKSGEEEDQKPYALKDIPGLKIAIATLTACTPEPGSTLAEGEQAFFRDIYVHSKLLVVDDVFSLLSSANINTRSLHTDSELGLAAPDAELAKRWREELWTLHVGESISDDKGRCDAIANFEKWNDVMDKNWSRKNKNEPLLAHLTRFWDVETPYAKAID